VNWRRLLRPRLRTLFLALNAATFLLSWGGLVVFRVYDNQLVRQTEAQLIAEGAVVAAAYARALRDQGAAGDPDYGLALPAERAPLFDPAQALRPVLARLDLGADEVRPPAEPPHPRAGAAGDARAAAAGRGLSPVLAEAKRVALAGIRVVDFTGTVVATSNEELGFGLEHREEVRRALAGEAVSLLRRRISDEPPPKYDSMSRETGVRVFVALPVVDGGRVWGAVVLSRTPMTLGKAFYQDRRSLLVTALILVGVLSLVALAAAAFIARPLRALVRQTEAIAAGAPAASVRAAGPGTREVAQLSEAFARMATLLEQRAEYIRAFAASVSHEFKTPLAAIQGTVELLREHLPTMSEGERERFLGNLAADAERLERLVRRLLDLARADVAAAPGAARSDAVTVAAAIADRYRADGRRVTVVIPPPPLPPVGAGALATPAAAPPPAPPVRMAPESLEAVLTNLVDNAVHHGGRAADVAVEIAVAPAGGGRAAVAIDVRDDGAGISPANAARIFEPFFTTARDRGGTGLGLTIVRALVRAHDGEVTLVPQERGACFRVVLPAAAA